MCKVQDLKKGYFFQAGLNEYNRKQTIVWKVKVNNGLFDTFNINTNGASTSAIYDGMWQMKCMVDMNDQFKISLQLVTLPTNLNGLDSNIILL